jgi:tetratricopeptide (TPR) repeat protein
MAGGARDRSKGAGTFWKWVGGVSAVLSLLFALQQFVSMISDMGERQRLFAELHKIARQQQAAADYEGAWASYEKALEIAQGGGQLAKLTGQLGEERRVLREAQEDLAMEWLEHVRVPEGRTFSDIIDKLVAVMHRGAVAAGGARKADLLAHLGWADFLRWRDGNRALSPERRYREALAIDAANPYAHAYWGHWMLWRRESVEEAQRHFSAALASGRARSLVRTIQLAALNNLTSEGEPAFVAAVSEMRKHDEPIDARTRQHVKSIYYFACGTRRDAGRLARLQAAVPVAEQLATLDALFSDTGSRDPGLDACRAALQEAAKDKP